jgi:hypothetical protein
VGAGEVATRIQTDTRAFHMIYFSLSLLSSSRFGTTGYLREGRACGNLHRRLHYRIRYRIRPFLAVGPGAFLCPTCFRSHGRRDEQVCFWLRSVRLSFNSRNRSNSDNHLGYLLSMLPRAALWQKKSFLRSVPLRRSAPRASYLRPTTLTSMGPFRLILRLPIGLVGVSLLCFS